MPFIRITAVDKPKEQVEKVIENIHKVVKEGFDMPSDKIWIVYDEIPRENFYIGGKSLKKN